MNNAPVKSSSSIDSLEGFLTACDALPNEFSICARNSTARGPTLTGQILAFPNGTGFRTLSNRNPSVCVTSSDTEVVVHACGPHLWADVLFERNDSGKFAAVQVSIGNAGMSGASTYRPDPNLLGLLATVTKAKPLYKGDAVAHLAKLLDGSSRFGAAKMAAGYEHFCTSDAKGYVGALRSIHEQLVARKLRTLDHRYRPERMRKILEGLRNAS
jgi:hypothetical protein